MTTLLKKLTKLKPSNNINGVEVEQKETLQKVEKTLSPFKEGYGMSKKMRRESTKFESISRKNVRSF